MQPELKNMRLFIWDFDGTLMDTYPVTFVSYLQRALQDLGHPTSYEEIMQQMMVTVPHAIRYYAQRYVLPQLRD